MISSSSSIELAMIFKVADSRDFYSLTMKFYVFMFYVFISAINE
jgi:hypothetical protein